MKVVHRLSVQQMAGQPQPMQVYLLSALSGVKYYQMLNKRIASPSQEWDRLSREVRAAEALYTTTGPEGQ